MSLPIGEYALLGDCQSAALVSRTGSIDWWCPARFDARSVFARLLDPEAGHFTINPTLPYEVARAYEPDTMVLRTTFRTDAGTVLLSDALVFADGARGHAIGMRSPRVLARQIDCLSGEVQLSVEFAPRPEYGLVTPSLRQIPAGVLTVGGADTLLLATATRLTLDGATARGQITLRQGELGSFTLHHRAGMSQTEFTLVDGPHAIEDTAAGWRSWMGEHVRYDGVYHEHVNRSALVLQALTYQPSGTIVAAPTTSLPEILGGEANWDYRYAWLRDTSLTMNALWIAACPHEAARYFDWMAAAVCHQPGRPVQIMFGVEGERDLSEHELDHLSGYAGSRPVRVGNEAWRQRQLDVMGEILEGAYIMRNSLELKPATASFLCDLADRAATDWQAPDAGIWEGRDGERHYTSSKLMCWVALDRAVKLAPRLGERARPQAWAEQRDELHDAILDQAYQAEIAAYGGAFGSDHLDASVLLMPIMGFVEADDERMLTTIHAIDRELGADGLVRRWTGTSQDEGAFVICSYWLASCLAQAGELDRAREVFEHITSHANDLGLLAEEVDPRDGSLLGNFPQAFSHVGLITAAARIDQATRDQNRSEQATRDHSEESP